MEKYLDTVIAERDAKDLQDTREQILQCFEKITCYGLSHPGFAVTKKKFTGDVDSIEPQFLNLLDRYCARVFDPVNLKPKVIHGRELTATELGTYIQTYADLFASGAKFPTAATLLEATASANNTNAVYMAVAKYKETMDRVAGPHCSNYVKPEELKEDHVLAEAATMEIFESIANFGSKNSIKEARVKVETQLASSFEVYDSLNNGRNPLLGLETYVQREGYSIYLLAMLLLVKDGMFLTLPLCRYHRYLLPLAIALLAIVLRWITDLTCSPYSQVCRAGSELFSHIYAVIMIFFVIIGATKAQQVKAVLKKFQSAWEVMNDAPVSGKKRKSD
jgi:atlastin